MILLTASFSSASSQADPPTFKYFPAGKIYKGATAQLVLGRDDRTFKTRLQWAAKHLKPNFAGHYILTTWGCGAECLMGAVIDAKSGKVYWWNFTICCWPPGNEDNLSPIEFRADRRLIIFTGLRNEKEGDDGKHFYVFDNCVGEPLKRGVGVAGLPNEGELHRREFSMIGVFVTFRYADNFDEQAVRKIAETARTKFEGMPGLRSKAFTVNSEKRQATNFYIWDSEDAANAFFTDALLESVTGLYGVRPSVEFVQIATLVENVQA
jgi:hypothetical protein